MDIIIQHICGDSGLFNIDLGIARSEEDFIMAYAEIIAKSKRLCLKCWQARKLASAQAMMPDLPPIIQGSHSQIQYALSIRPAIIKRIASLIENQRREGADGIREMEQAFQKLMRCQDAQFWLAHKKGYEALQAMMQAR